MSDDVSMNQHLGTSKKTDYLKYNEGSEFEPLHKTIETLISASDEFIVFLDEHLYVEWDYDGDPPEGEGEIMNRVGNLEGLSRLLLEEPFLEHIERLLGESVVRLLEEDDTREANLILDEAEKFLKARSSEKARMWYLTSSSFVALIGLIIAFILWLANKKGYSPLYLKGNALDIAEGTLLGGVGALISVLSRAESLNMDIAAGRLVYYIEGAARVILGMLGSFLAALMIKADLVLGLLNHKNYGVASLLVLCLVAGASERLVPNLIRQVESGAWLSTRPEKEQEGNNKAAQEKDAS